MPSNGFQPDASVFTAFWRNQLFDSLGNVTTENYVNFGLVKWFTTNRAAASPGSQDQVQIWYNPKEQNPNPDLTLLGAPATSLLTALDSIWAGSGSTSGFQPESAIDTAMWRYQYLNSNNVVSNEIYLCMGAIKWMKTLRSPLAGGRTATVSLWFNNKDQDFNPDLVLDDGPSAKLLSDLDAIWAN